MAQQVEPRCTAIPKVPRSQFSPQATPQFSQLGAEVLPAAWETQLEDLTAAGTWGVSQQMGELSQCTLWLSCGEILSPCLSNF